MHDSWLSALALPYVRLELPGWGKVLSMARRSAAFGKNGDPEIRTIRGKTHGCLIDVDIASRHEHAIYYLGRSEELDTELFLQATLRPGETFVDVGANIGMLTLLASRLVGSEGKVISFEPSPREAGRIRRALAINRIANVTLYQIALSDSEGQMTLRVPQGFSALGTLAHLANGDAHPAVEEFQVEVKRGDNVLGELSGPTMIKVDVEGFEVAVLSGMPSILSTLRPAVLTEVEPRWLERARTSSKDLFRCMHSLGYQPYHLRIQRRGLRYYLAPRPLTDAASFDRSKRKDSERNVAWIHPESVFDQRFKHQCAP